MKNFLLKSGAVFSYNGGFKPVIVKGIYGRGGKKDLIKVSGKELAKHFPNSFDADDWLYSFKDFLEVPDEALPEEGLSKETITASKATKTPTPRYRKKRIAPPVRKKTDVRISYNNGMRYTITNALSFVLNKEQEDIVSITSLVKGIRTTVELPLKDIQFMKVLTPTGVYDIHNEGYYNTALVVSLTHKMSSACSYFSLSFE